MGGKALSAALTPTVSEQRDVYLEISALFLNPSKTQSTETPQQSVFIKNYDGRVNVKNADYRQLQNKKLKPPSLLLNHQLLMRVPNGLPGNGAHDIVGIHGDCIPISLLLSVLCGDVFIIKLGFHGFVTLVSCVAA